MSDLVGNPEDRFSHVEAHQRFVSRRFGNENISMTIQPFH